MTANAECPGCGKTGFHKEYMGEVGARMKLTGECFDCAFWELRCIEGEHLVIDNNVYGIGPEPKDINQVNRSSLGMSGRRFDIEMFSGERYTTHNLWSGGYIPERFRDRLPNTARFVGASREQVGEMVCWNPSSENNPPYPTYNGGAS